MKGFRFLIILSALLLFTSSLRSQTTLADSIFHPDSLRYIVEVLASDSLQGRFTGTGENLKAALFIAKEFERAGINPVAGNKGYFMEVKPSWFNVVGAIQGKSRPGQVIVFSAHYDHVGTIKTNPYPNTGGIAIAEEGDEIYNGANDNASGVAAVISLAKYFATLKNNERTLIFVAFTGEEIGLLGSQYLAEQCEPDSIITVINIEMIGRGPAQNSHPYITGHEYSDLISVLNHNYRAFAEKKSEKTFFKADPFIRNFLFTRSDNYPFARKGIPAHTVFVTSPYDKYYHNKNDETETLNFLLMKKIIHGVAISVTGIVKGTDTPKRITGF